MGLSIPHMGATLNAWRERKGCTPRDWADRLHECLRKGVIDTIPEIRDTDEHQLAQNLRVMERESKWPYDTPLDAALAFFKACHIALVEEEWEREPAGALVYLVASYMWQRGVLLVEPQPPPYDFN